MDVAARAIHGALGDAKDLDPPRDIQEPHTAWREPAVARAAHEGLDPGVSVDAVPDEQVRAPEFDHEARPEFEVVRVLVAAGERVHLDQIAAHGLGEGFEIGQGGDHAELVPRRSAAG